MESVYVLEPGAYLRREGAALKVMRGGKVADRIPASGLKRLMLVGYVSLTGPVLDFLIRSRVETVFVTPTGRFRARLGLDEHRHVALRRGQYLRLSDKGFALAAARGIVKGKLTNMYHFLRIRAKQYDERHLKVAALKIRSLAEHSDTASDADVLRGIEGAGSRIYFGVFSFLIRNDAFFFHGRNRRPPLDPVNALLSFVYTLLTNEVLSAIKIAGLDPYLGSLHDIEYGRPSLACDLVEEYRAFLGDRMVLGLINRKMIRTDDFIFREGQAAGYADEAEMRKKRPVEMKPAVGRAFIATYEEMMNRRIFYGPSGKKVTYRQLMLHQARRFGESLVKEDTAYEPFAWSNS